MQACGRLVARMGEQDVDRDIAAGIEIDGGDMALVMGDLDDPAIDDRYVAARHIGLDIGRNVMTIGEDSQLVSPIVEQPDRLVRLRAGPDKAPMLAGDFKAVAIGAGHDGGAPAFGKARNIRHLVDDAIAQDQAARPKAFAIGSEDGEIVDGAGDAVGPGIDQADRGIARQLLPRLGQDVQRWLVIVAEQTMRMAGEAVARQAGIENGDLAAGTAELQGGGKTGKAAADDDDVIHGDGLRIVNGGGWRNHRHRSCPFWAAPADNLIKLLARAGRKRFSSRLLLTARDRTIAPTMVERTAIAVSVESSSSDSPSQGRSISRYFLIQASNDAFTTGPCRAASAPSATTGQPSPLSSRCPMLKYNAITVPSGSFGLASAAADNSRMALSNARSDACAAKSSFE